MFSYIEKPMKKLRVGLFTLCFAELPHPQTKKNV
jgi:hypothetical protein